MPKILKFPTEKIVMENKIKTSYKAQDYEAVTKNANYLIDEFEFFKKTETYDVLLLSYFNLRLFSEALDKGMSIFSKGYETYEFLSILLMCYIEKLDMFSANLFINKSVLLNTLENKEFFDIEKAVYGEMKLIKERSRVITLLLVLFLKAMFKEMLGNFKIDREYMLYRFYDVINLIQEYGYDEGVVAEMEKCAKYIFLK